MHRFGLAAVAAVTMLASAPAQAAVLYEFSFSRIPVAEGDTGSVSFLYENYATTGNEVITKAQAISCAYHSASIDGCLGSVGDIYPQTGFYFGTDARDAFRFYVPTGPATGLPTPFFFANGALATNGHYVSDDGLATLDVSGSPGEIAVVPEPSTWALSMVGFGLAGGALRRRRTVTA